METKKKQGRILSTPMDKRLAAAVQEKDIGEIRRYLDLDANPETTDLMTGLPLLSLAASTGSIEIMELLVKAGADPNHTSIREHRTALHECAWSEQRESAAWLVKQGANPAPVDLNGYSPEDVARCYNKTAMADFLRELASEKHAGQVKTAYRHKRQSTLRL